MGLRSVAASTVKFLLTQQLERLQIIEPQLGPWLADAEQRDLLAARHDISPVDALALYDSQQKLTQLLPLASQPNQASVFDVDYTTFNIRREIDLTVAYGAGALLVEHEKMVAARAPLPEGYTYDDSGVISFEEIAALTKLAMPDDAEDYDVAGVKDYHISLLMKDISTITTGVRSQNGQLVGFSRLSYKGSHGELGDFMVDPNHQSRGIGKAMIDTRLNYAEAAGVTSLYMPYLEPTNTLRSYYYEKGFFEYIPDGPVMRGPDPKRL